MTNTEFKEYALYAINKMYRNDPWVRELYQSAGLQLQDIDGVLDELLNNGFFDAVGDRGIRVYEKDLGISPSGSLEQRRAMVEMLWHNNGKCDLEKIKAIIKTFVDDDADVIFKNGILHLEFNDSSFVYAIDKLRENLKIVKPAHIGLSIADAHNVGGGVYVGSVVMTKETVTIEPNIGYNAEMDTANIYGAVWVKRIHVVNNINS